MLSASFDLTGGGKKGSNTSGVGCGDGKNGSTPGSVAKRRRKLVLTPGYNRLRITQPDELDDGLVGSDLRPLLQLRVLRLGFLHYGNVGVGVLPEGEEILVRTLRFGGVAREAVGAGQTQVRQCADWLV